MRIFCLKVAYFTVNWKKEKNVKLLNLDYNTECIPMWFSFSDSLRTPWIWINNPPYRNIYPPLLHIFIKMNILCEQSCCQLSFLIDLFLENSLVPTNRKLPRGKKFLPNSLCEKGNYHYHYYIIIICKLGRFNLYQPD